MKIRKSAFDDLNEILAIYAYAREQMRRSGNPDQWGTDRPSADTIKNDIQTGCSYVITDSKTNDPVGVFAFVTGDEPTYQRIENGSWPNHEPYGTIHRIAGNGRQKGIFHCCMRFCESRATDMRINNIRIDTHKNNARMQHLLESSGYQKCGVIYVSENSPRIAYQKVLTPDPLKNY